MCGIAGIFSSRESKDIGARMSDAIRHRGPDDADLVTLVDSAGNHRGAFAHRRLAIIDLTSAGHQPMYTPDGALCINYNGEIYNYADLRADLAREGVSFRGHCDTEVLLLGWQRHGIGFLQRLRGMFAFAIWDAAADRGWLGRDAFGIKPLYMAEKAGAILFASEVRAISESGVVAKALSAPAVASYLRTGSVAEPFTIIDGVFAVPPGCVVEIQGQGDSFAAGEPIRFLSAFPPHRGSETGTTDVRMALRESVESHLVSDVPVAVFLSGGIDSSTVAALASEASAQPIESFTVTFTEAGYSEAAPARDMARHIGANHHEVPVSGTDLLSMLPAFFLAMDQPSIDGLNSFVVSGAVRSFGFKVVLSGLGGDELFGGYPSFRRSRYLEPLWRLPAPLRKAGAAAAGSFGDHRSQRLQSALAGSSPAAGSYNASRTLFSERQLDSLATQSRQSPGQIHQPDGINMSDLTLEQQVSLHELSGYMRNTLLRDSDVFSMAHSLELRVPFVDLEVAGAAFAAAAAAPDALRRSGKPLLADAVRDLLPAETFERTKQGFTLPFEEWMRGSLFDEVNQMVTQSDTRPVGLEKRAVEDVWKQFQQRRSHVSWSRPWALYTLLRWAKENGITTAARVAG